MRNAFLFGQLVLVVAPAITAYAADDQPAPQDTCIIELSVPAGARVTVDGQDYGEKRRFTFDSLAPDQAYTSQVVVAFREGARIERTVLMKGGWHVRLPLRAPNAPQLELVPQTGHTNDIWSVDFSPDGRRVLTASNDDLAILWDAETGRTLRTFAGHVNGLIFAHFTPDGTRIVTGAGDSTAALWDPNSGEKLRTFNAHQNWVWDVCFSPDGRQMLTGAADKTAILWDLASGQLLRTLEGHTDTVDAVAFSPDGRKILTASSDKKVILWDAATGARLQTLDATAPLYRRTADFSADGRQVKTILSSDKKVILWDAETGAKVGTFEVQPGFDVFARHFTPDRQHVLMGIRFSKLHPNAAADPIRLRRGWMGVFWRTVDERLAKQLGLSRTSGALIETVLPDSPAERSGILVGDIVIRANGQQVANWFQAHNALAGIDAGAEVLIEVVRKQETRQVKVVFAERPSDGDFVRLYRQAAEAGNARAQYQLGRAYSNGEGVAEDFAQAMKWFRLGADQGHPYAQNNLGWMYHNGRGVPKDPQEAMKWYRLAADQGEDVALCNVGVLYQYGLGVPKDEQEAAKWYRLSTAQGYADAERRLEGLGLGQNNMRSELIVWDTVSGKIVRRVEVADAANPMKLSPDGKRAVTESKAQNSSAVLWDLERGEKLRTFQGRGSGVRSVAFSSDGRQVLAGSRDKLAVLWDLAAGGPPKILQGHKGQVSRVCFCPEGRGIVTGSDDNTAILWDAQSGQKIRTFEGHSGSIRALAISPDGRQFVTGSTDKTAILWDVDSGRQIRTFQGDEAVVSVSFGPGGTQLLTLTGVEGEQIPTIALWETATGEEVRHFRSNKRTFRSAALSPDGQQILIGLWSGGAVLMEPTLGSTLATFKAYRLMVGAVAFSPDGRQVLASSNDHTAALWEANTGRLFHTLKGHTDGVYTVAFRPDGRQVLTGSGDGSVRLWDAATGDELACLMCLDGGKEWLVVTPEGLFDGSEGGRTAVAFRRGGGLDVVPADEVAQRYFRPGLLAEIGRGQRPMPPE